MSIISTYNCKWILVSPRGWCEGGGGVGGGGGWRGGEVKGDKSKYIIVMVQTIPELTASQACFC